MEKGRGRRGSVRTRWRPRIRPRRRTRARLVAECALGDCVPEMFLPKLSTSCLFWDMPGHARALGVSRELRLDPI